MTTEHEGIDFDERCPVCKSEDLSWIDYQVEAEDGGYYADLSKCGDCGCLITVSYDLSFAGIDYETPDPPPAPEGPDLSDQSIPGRLASIRKVLGGHDPDRLDTDPTV